MNSPKHSAKGKCLFIGISSNFPEVQTVVNLKACLVFKSSETNNLRFFQVKWKTVSGILSRLVSHVLFPRPLQFLILFNLLVHTLWVFSVYNIFGAKYVYFYFFQVKWKTVSGILSRLVSHVLFPRPLQFLILFNLLVHTLWVFSVYNIFGAKYVYFSLEVQWGAKNFQTFF